MGKGQMKAQKNAIKMIIKSRVPKGKQKEVLEAVDKLDLNTLMGMLKDPKTFSDMMSNPSRLNEFVVSDEEGVVTEAENVETKEVNVDEVEDSIEASDDK